MTEYATIHSFIIRIYRGDTQDPRKIAGRVEALDGSGMSASFADLDALGEIVHRCAHDCGTEFTPEGFQKNKRARRSKEEK